MQIYYKKQNSFKGLYLLISKRHQGTCKGLKNQLICRAKLSECSKPLKAENLPKWKQERGDKWLPLF